MERVDIRYIFPVRARRGARTTRDRARGSSRSAFVGGSLPMSGGMTMTPPASKFSPREPTLGRSKTLLTAKRERASRRRHRQRVRIAQCRRLAAHQVRSRLVARTCAGAFILFPHRLFISRAVQLTHPALSPSRSPNFKLMPLACRETGIARPDGRSPRSSGAYYRSGAPYAGRGVEDQPPSSAQTS